MSITAIDIGGTFTDLASLDPKTGELRFSKSLTTPPEFEVGALDCMRLADIPGNVISVLRHGTTVVINTLLERTGARTALITTEGFRDIVEIGRGNRPEAFNLFYERLPSVVLRRHRFEIRERLNARGDVLTPLDQEALPHLVKMLREEGIEAVAVCLLHAWRDPRHELLIGDYLRKHTDCFVSCSHEISREFREYERTTTTILNAYVGPQVQKYLGRFDSSLQKTGFKGRMYLMGSNGGVLSGTDAHDRPLLLVESGPVGGAAGAVEIGACIGMQNLVAFDMGGTTAKAVLIEDGQLSVTPVYWVGGYERGYPVQAAVLDIVEVGTGGGSIAEVNEFGALQVGPRSAGAAPGPACYARGGKLPTVTDANVVLGRLDSKRFLGGTMPLRDDLAVAALEQLAQLLKEDPLRLASGILRIATVNMATAVRKVTVERGYDPRDFSLVAFGGAGPLHAVAVAREIGMQHVIIPPHPGHFSAYGMLFADFRYDLSDTIATSLEALDVEDMERRFAELEAQGRRKVDAAGVNFEALRGTRFVEMRYEQQEHTVKVRLTDALVKQLQHERPDVAAVKQELRQLFEQTYGRRYGHVSPDVPVDTVMLRVVVDGRTVRPDMKTATARTESARPQKREIWMDDAGPRECDVWCRDELGVGARVSGPAVIEEDASTTVLHPGDVAEVHSSGCIFITLARSEGTA